MKIAILLLTILVSQPLVATELYRWQDDQGRIHYADTLPDQPPAAHDQPQLPHLNSQAPPVPSRVDPQRPPTSPTVAATRQGKATLAECIKKKRQAIAATKRRPLNGAAELDSWLWRNCRGFAHELRRVSQELM